MDTILFDAGGTLVHTDCFRVARLIGQSEEDAARLAAAWYHAIYAYDELRLHKGGDWRSASEGDLWTWFWNRMAEAAGTPPISDEAAARIVAENRRKNLWTAINPDAAPVLKHLQGRYRLGVVSNSDGTVRKTFEELGLDRWFAVIVDSEVVGVAKPDPAIFQHALEPLGSVPQRTVFIGDSYALDVVGAQRAGIRPILLDPYGLHAHRAVERIARLSELSKLFP